MCVGKALQSCESTETSWVAVGSTLVVKGAGQSPLNSHPQLRGSLHSLHEDGLGAVSPHQNLRGDSWGLKAPGIAILSPL